MREYEYELTILADAKSHKDLTKISQAMYPVPGKKDVLFRPTGRSKLLFVPEKFWDDPTESVAWPFPADRLLGVRFRRDGERLFVTYQTA